ncbi:MAG: hypothetical protein OWU84_13380 [Firmicutes bacterium]|nr:hypothetical protein [Bacillota bacterium]
MMVPVMHASDPAGWTWIVAVIGILVIITAFLIMVARASEPATRKHGRYPRSRARPRQRRRHSVVVAFPRGPKRAWYRHRYAIRHRRAVPGAPGSLKSASLHRKWN